jgi:thioesterase domain-containing protein/acyl carrier protein
VPSNIVFLGALPLNGNGKVDRHSLPAPGHSGDEMVPPRDDLERKVMGIWTGVLGLEEPVGVTDEFFELGGDSLLAVHLLAEMERDFGRRVPLSIFLKGATVAELARMLRGRGDDGSANAPSLFRSRGPAQPSSLYPLQPVGSRPPLFFPAAGRGGFLALRHLLPALEEDQPVFGLWTPGLFAGERTGLSIEKAAAASVEVMREAQPEGPYFLCGHSIGGVVAYEMAQQLVAQGQEIGLLLMVDPEPGGLEPPVRDPLARRLAQGAIRTGHQLKVAMPWNRKPVSFVDGTDVVVNTTAAKARQRAYTIRRSATPAVLFAAEESVSAWGDPYRGWRPFLPDGSVAVELPGDHLSMLMEPQVHVLVEKLADCLRSAQGVLEKT